MMWFTKRLLSTVVRRSHYGGHCGLFLRPQHCSIPELEPRHLQCTCCWRSRVPIIGIKTLEATLTSKSASGKQDGKALDAEYTSEQRDVILNLLNTATQSELSVVKLLRGRKSHNIVEYRAQNGPFKTLESVLNVRFLKQKSAVTVFDSILNPVKRGGKRKVTFELARFIKPEVDRSWLMEASSIVSIVCGLNKIAWSHVDRRMNVLDLQQVACPNFLNRTYLASAYLNNVSKIVSLLPPADFYIVEKSSLSLQNTTLFPVLAHMMAVEAMLFALLEPRRTPSDETPPRVLNMTRSSVGRHFGLMLGSSRTSGAQLVERLMVESVTKELPRIRFPQALLMKHKNSFQMNSRGGDEICDALLQAVAFFEILRESSR